MGARSAVATAWLATQHQQLMYLLSPEGKTVFYIPGVEVVHKVSSPINLPDEASKMEPGKMQPPPGGSRKRAAGLSLDLNSSSAKRNKQVQSLLTSPDVQMLKLTSPELEKFLIQNPTLATPTPSGYIFPKSVTEEQAMYAKGFEEALEHLRQSEPPGSNDLAAANTLATLSTEALTCTRVYWRRHKTRGFLSLYKPPPIPALLQPPRGPMTLRPTRSQTG